MSRTKNVSRNLFWGIVNKMVAILLPFLARTVILYKLGTEYLGLSSLFTSVLGVLSLTELGFGNALIYNMYEPMANNNVEKVNALLKLYKDCYKIIGSIILAAGILLLPFLKYLIKGNVPSDVNLYILYAIYLLNTVISYFLFAYKKSIFYALQRTDLDSNINTIVTIAKDLSQVIVVLVFADYYVYAIVLPLSTLLNNLWVSRAVDRTYPQFRCEGEINKSELKAILKNIKGLIFQKLGGVVLFSVDNIVISAFLGLHILAIYNNYYYIVTSLTGIMAIIMNAMKPSVGNSIVKESLEKNYKDFKKFNFLYLWIVSWAAITLMNLYQPFMHLWTGEKLMLPVGFAILFAIYFFVNKWFDMIFVYQEATGLWYENRFVPLIAAILNLVLNITMVQIIGLAGILLSTIISILLVYNVGATYILFKHYFKNISLIRAYFFRQFLYVFVFGILGVATFIICNRIVTGNDVLTLLIRFIICVTLPNIGVLIVFRDEENFKETMKLILQIVKRI